MTRRYRSTCCLRWGDAAKIKLSDVALRIRGHYSALSGEGLPVLALQIVQAPVFHGYVASVLVELRDAATVEQVEAALGSDAIEVVQGDGDAPSNVGAAGQSKIMVRNKRRGRASYPVLALAGDRQFKTGGC